MSEVQSQRLQRAYETAKNSLDITTQVSLGVQATMYRMDISFKSTRNKWTIAKRYSDFHLLREQLRKLVKQFKQQRGKSNWPAPVVALDKTLAAPFPRRRFRTDNALIIAERKAALEAFVQSLVKIMATIPMIADVNGEAPTCVAGQTPTEAEASLLLALYLSLRDFLAYPDTQIESEAKLKLAVLALEDVVVDAKSNLLASSERASCSECCCICLDEWDDEQCVGMSVVRLPCQHVFHEDCLLEWLQGNAHCPICREDPTSARSSLDDPACDHKHC